MKRKSKQKKQQGNLFPCSLEDVKTALSQSMNDNPDFYAKFIDISDQQRIGFYYISSITDDKVLYNQIVSTLMEAKKYLDYKSIDNMIPLPEPTKEKKVDKIDDHLLQGAVCIYIENETSCVNYSIPRQESRSPEPPETESLIFGPQVAFTGSIETNVNIVRNMVDSKQLKIEKFLVGEKIPTEVQMVYLDDLANDDVINEFRNRLTGLEVEDILNSSTLSQKIEDNPYSIFPQLLVTELPDRFTYSLKEGKIGVLVDNSHTSIIGPITFTSFFESTEDLYSRWTIGAFIRLMRIMAMVLSISMTPLYVAALTYHYEVIPEALLLALGESRSRVPFPPLFETLLLETLMEFIREAGARLPTKVGQTMGIVGGIVVGQAVVQAGFTSNILIILVALSALASFTTPSYLMGSALRIVRFSIILISGVFGFVGFFFAMAFILIHLLRLRSLELPYTAPFYPFQYKDLDESLIRLPYVLDRNRAKSNLPKKVGRNASRSQHPIFRTSKKDIDE